MPDLNQELRDGGYADLATSLEKIQASVVQMWQSNQLLDFTDHGPEHSRRVAAYAENLIAIRPVPQAYVLSLPERYLLCAAAWVHDLGMQDRRSDPSDPANRTISSAEEVRKRHPQRSEYIVRKREVDLGLPAREVLAPQIISLLALAHGTSTYENALVRLHTEASSFKGVDIRAGRLAAILLMADELDLHYERVPDSNPLRPLNRESEAHWLKHECVKKVELLNTDAGIEIVVHLMIPTNLANHQTLEVREWIVTKFQEQIALTEAELEHGFGGHFFFSRRVRVVPGSIDRESPLVHADSLAVIERENARGRLINHQVCLGGALAALEVGQSVVLVGELGSGGEDTMGREDVLDTVCANNRAVGFRILRNSATSSFFGATELSEVLGGWLAEVSGVITVRGDHDEMDLRIAALDDLAEKLAEDADQQFLIAYSGADRSEDPEWVMSAFARLGALPNVVIALTAGTAFHTDTDSAGDFPWTRIEVGSTPVVESAAFLSRVVASEDAEILAAAHDGSYLQTKTVFRRYISGMLTT